jgi:hypothetical protein
MTPSMIVIPSPRKGARNPYGRLAQWWSKKKSNGLLAALSMKGGLDSTPTPPPIPSLQIPLNYFSADIAMVRPGADAPISALTASQVCTTTMTIITMLAGAAKRFTNGTTHATALMG